MCVAVFTRHLAAAAAAGEAWAQGGEPPPVLSDSLPQVCAAARIYAYRCPSWACPAPAAAARSGVNTEAKKSAALADVAS